MFTIDTDTQFTEDLNRPDLVKLPELRPNQFYQIKVWGSGALLRIYYADNPARARFLAKLSLIAHNPTEVRSFRARWTTQGDEVAVHNGNTALDSLVGSYITAV